MNYQIVINEDELKRFIDWLPELQQHETFYCCLVARNKYIKGFANLPILASSQALLKRFTATKKNLLSKIKQLELPINTYVQKDIVIPQEALALYISINPRNLLIATQRSIKKFVDLICQPYNGYNPHDEVLSEIAKSKSKTRFVSFDFDLDKEEYIEGYSIKLQWLQEQIGLFLNDEAYNIIETRGGAHVIVRTSRISEDLKRSWYHNMATLLYCNSEDCDNKGDIMLPVPGTYQGGFSPYFFK